MRSVPSPAPPPAEQPSEAALDRDAESFPGPEAEPPLVTVNVDPEDTAPDAGADAPLVRLEVCLSIIRPTIRFESLQTSPTSESSAVFEQVASILRDRSDLLVEVQGHADTTERGGGQNLSELRARAVKQELVRRGVAEQRLCVEGFSDTRPIASNQTEAGRAANRRVEFEIQEPGTPCRR